STVRPGTGRPKLRMTRGNAARRPQEMTPGQGSGRRRQWHADGMILACHTLIYSDDADATRAFFRDVLGFPNVDAGTGDHNWLIFKTGPSELGVHPTSREGYSSPRHQAISFVVDDLDSTMSELRAKGAEFSSGP